ncbi:MAG TPA: hypothetical protein VHN37_13655 [Actinomycetota bacterium]|nr:hypothetical protein [Actinomycetota bacterium]
MRQPDDNRMDEVLARMSDIEKEVRTVRQILVALLVIVLLPVAFGILQILSVLVL